MLDHELGRKDSMLNIIQGLKLHERYCQVGDCVPNKENIIKLKYWEVNIEEMEKKTNKTEMLGNILRGKKMLYRN